MLLNALLNVLLDGYDFYAQRYPPTNASESFELADVQVSISAIGPLTSKIAHWISDMRNGKPRIVSSIGFELHVLNEFALHAHSIAFFLAVKGIDLDAFEPRAFGRAIDTLKHVNRSL